ncbi:Adenosylcobinamide amidohydrolase [Paenibacillus sp. UNCCL117]|uniref:adenosylcobinamide amidohydrolase n=1 Tax=unclassified Paenibacillus TaxID=185978 RepID=UPI00088A347B|nr:MULTISPECIES: adenosylcobinamide amidohydrolase [unclassified Paenibacillus]SDC25109.1 Adenosylcobinamide amidohydrolase [Paenibacillus sp. cl123]SFW19753.1 Adenosylcobinamide amidohydrolase [Paenibacillus sp. UNCCL117]
MTAARSAETCSPDGQSGPYRPDDALVRPDSSRAVCDEAGRLYASLREAAGEGGMLSEQAVERGEESYFLLTSREPLRALNSSLWGEGFSSACRLMNRQVSKHYMADDPVEEMNAFLRQEGIAVEGTAALLTAADLRDRSYRGLRMSDELAVHAWVTAGLRNKCRAGTPCDISQLYPGTINIIVAIEGWLTDSAFVNAVITVTEAKAAALQDMQIKLDSGATATGTTTDAVLLAATQRGEKSRYAGLSTRLGYAIGLTVYEAAKESIGLYGKRIQSFV